ncbi:MAG TPA: FRG domain-containing protein [Geothermobacteraceae bacterium]|nr:FRG domain-containing protein [Geothermobacteraceae bacterium]
MIISTPKIKSTIASPDCREWVPTSLDNLLKEIDHLTKTDAETDSLTLFRGQANEEWPLDSTFVRNSIKNIFNIRNYQKIPISIRHQLSFHRTIASLLLLKFGGIYKPSQEALEKEISHGIDPWFELLKNMQQYPEEYDQVDFIKGTFFIDWTYSLDIALYFATYNGIGAERKTGQIDGAIWLFDSSAVGKILQIEKLGKIFKKMTNNEFLNGEAGLPLMFHPIRQTNQRRATNQTPIYLAQMDFRYDLADAWAGFENQANKWVFVKIRILNSIKNDLERYLHNKGIDESFVYPH